MGKKQIVKYLKFSSERIGRLYPILLDKHGNIIDGMHRLAADEKWPKMKLEKITTEEQCLIARIISNVCRRPVLAKEKREMLEKLGEIYLEEGVEPGKIAYKIAEETGMSYTWVMKYLPEKFKNGVKSRSARVTHCVAETSKLNMFSLDPKEQPQGVVAIKNYGNTNFVSVMLERDLYKRLEETAKILNTTPVKLIYRALCMIINNKL